LELIVRRRGIGSWGLSRGDHHGLLLLALAFALLGGLRHHLLLFLPLSLHYLLYLLTSIIIILRNIVFRIGWRIGIAERGKFELLDVRTTAKRWQKGTKIK
jgi:hypothetical protein